MRFSHLLPFLFFVLFLLVCQHQAAAAGSSETLSDYEDEGEGEVSSHNARQDENLFIPHDTTEHLRESHLLPSPSTPATPSSHQAPFSRAALQNEVKGPDSPVPMSMGMFQRAERFLPDAKPERSDSPGPEMKQERPDSPSHMIMDEERRFQSTTGSPPPPPPTRFFREFKSSSRMTPIFSPSNSPRDGQTLSHTAQPFSPRYKQPQTRMPTSRAAEDVQWRRSGPQSPPALAELRAKTQLDRMRMIAASYGPTMSPEGSPPDSQQTMMRAMERDRNQEARRLQLQQDEASSSRGVSPMSLLEEVQAGSARSEAARRLSRLAMEQGPPGPPGHSPPSLSQLFSQYRSPSPGELPGTFMIDGMPYGHIRARPLPLLPMPSSFLSPSERAAATVIIPDHLDDIAVRETSKRVAANVHYDMITRKSWAREGQRLYKVEAGNIRDHIQRSRTLLLHTSEEFRLWALIHGPAVLRSQRLPASLVEVGLDRPWLEAQERLARALEQAQQTGQTAIPLSTGHDRSAGNILVTWWLGRNTGQLANSLLHTHP